MYINDHVLGDAIVASGMPLWELASRVGVSPDELVYRDSLQHLPLGVAIRLAEVLDVPVGDLFAGTQAGESEDPADASVIGAALGEHPQGLTREDLARALGWDLDRVETALRQLDVLLSATGLRLGGDADRIRVLGAPGRLTPATRAALERSDPGNGMVDVDVAQVVWSVIFEPARGRAVPQEGMRSAQRWQLVNFGGSYAEPSESVRFSLLLPEAGA